MKKKNPESKNTIRRILRLVRPYGGLIALTLCLAALTVICILYAPIVIGQAVDQLIGQGKVNFEGLSALTLRLAVTVAQAAISQWLMNVVNNKITFQVVRDMRVEAFRHMEILPLGYIDRHRPGDVISRLTTDVEQFSDGLLMGFTQLFTGVLTILGTLGFMLWYDWWITLVVVLLTPLSIFVAKFIAQRTYSMFLTGGVLLFSDQSLYPICQCPGLCGGRRSGGADCHWRRYYRRWSVRHAELCKPVYQTF